MYVRDPMLHFYWKVGTQKRFIFIRANPNHIDNQDKTHYLVLVVPPAKAIKYAQPLRKYSGPTDESPNVFSPSALSANYAKTQQVVCVHRVHGLLPFMLQLFMLLSFALDVHGLDHKHYEGVVTKLSVSIGRADDGNFAGNSSNACILRLGSLAL